MLDDQNLISTRDKSDALSVAATQHAQLSLKYDLNIGELGEIKNVVFAGMGGSALAGAMAKTWPGYNVPFTIVRDYDIPSFTGGDTLFIASSYSGNTEETLSALAAAEKTDAKIAVIAAGGKLIEIAKSKSYPLITLPDGMQPRMAAFASLRALVTVLESAGLADGASAELESKAAMLAKFAEGLTSNVPTADNKAKQIAQELMGKTVVVYSGPSLAPAGYKWKININENAKNVAWCNQYPEFNHNEFIGWSSHPVEKPYAVVDLVSDLDHAQIKKRFEISARLLSGQRPHPVTVQAVGKDVLEQMLTTIVLGDFVSLYLAVLNGLDPTPVDLVEKMKVELT